MLLKEYLDIFVISIHIGGIARSSIGLLALVTAPLPAMLLAYHVELIRRGMTTYESGKWTTWQHEITQKRAYLADIIKPENIVSRLNETKQIGQWKESRQVLVTTSDGLPPRNVPPELEAITGKDPQWQLCVNLQDVENIYDSGFWLNLKDGLQW